MLILKFQYCCKILNPNINHFILQILNFQNHCLKPTHNINLLPNNKSKNKNPKQKATKKQSNLIKNSNSHLFKPKSNHPKKFTNPIPNHFYSIPNHQTSFLISFSFLPSPIPIPSPFPYTQCNFILQKPSTLLSKTK